jgi:catechol 2,3-dioxygenase-like lactoylglutathione lyase family enzyme
MKGAAMNPSIHIALNVSDIDRSVAFYSRLFGEPAKVKPGYAKFVSEEPGLHLALQEGLGAAGGGPLSHLGIRVSSTADVLRRRADLLEKGLTGEDEIGTTCCYARQDKFWVSDPDGNRWEIYAVLEDVEEQPRAEAAACCVKGVSAEPPAS